MILLDTHALIWWQAGGTRLSARAQREIEGADELLVSPISFWEVGLLADKGRIALDRDPFAWTQDMLATERVSIAPLAASAAMSAGRLPSVGFSGDPADAIIYSTAAYLSVPLVTKDRRIRLFASHQKDVRTVW